MKRLSCSVSDRLILIMWGICSMFLLTFTTSNSQEKNTVQEENKRQVNSKDPNKNIPQDKQGAKHQIGKGARENGSIIKKTEKAMKRTLPFHSDVILGEPVQDDCITKCHIDFPFKRTSRVFDHNKHSPNRGFNCAICHVTVLLPNKFHGKLNLQENTCNGCHHDSDRFSSCEMCHMPVVRVVEVQGQIFRHIKHAFSDSSPPCTECHDDINRETKPDKESSPLVSCVKCHHATTSTVNCKNCHEKALIAGESTKLKGFDHGLHSSSIHLKNSCRSCHLQNNEIMIPSDLSCVLCHHPSNPQGAPRCIICHDMQSIRISREPHERPFSHSLHARKFQCNECHSTDERCSATAGNDCKRCHHQLPTGCMKCHPDELYFVKEYFNIPGGEKVLFLHSTHASDNNCSLCHLQGDEIRHGISNRDCALCHHHSGNMPTCKTCHETISKLRAGNMPSGRQGEQEVMNGIVTCQACHVFEPSEANAITDGSQSCERCHPIEYMHLLMDRRSVLERAFRKYGMDDEWKESDYFIKQAIHNFELSLDGLRKSSDVIKSK